MSGRAVQVLLVGSNFSSAPGLAGWLEKWGCDCQVAVSYHEACLLLEVDQFDVVLSSSSLPDGNAYRLISLLADSPVALFFCLSVEDSCWWLPALVQVQNRWGSPALRPREFARALDRLLHEFTLAAPSPAQAPGVADTEKPAFVLTPHVRGRKRAHTKRAPSPAGSAR